MSLASMSSNEKNKVSTPRRETGECRILDLDIPDLFVPYWPHMEETLVGSTNELLQKFDRAATAGLRAFEGIADLSRRLVHIDVAFTSQRGMLLDTIHALSSEYDDLMAAVLTAHASCAYDLLERRAPFRPPGSSRLPIVGTLADWQRGLAQMEMHAKAIAERWVEVIKVLRIQLKPLSDPPSWLLWVRWMTWGVDVEGVKSDLRDLTNDLRTIEQTAPRDIAELVRSYAAVGLAFQQTRLSASTNNLHAIDSTLGELIRLDTAFIKYRAGFWITSRLVVDRYEMGDLKNSPLRDLIMEEDDYLREHCRHPGGVMWLDSYK
ncbi:hypothetical protein FB45DRAFT_949126 [Roridomyces roridus]|uniref:Uncharacterized protein n=1 Tax=Roridomyces roridus TaxID=1738132 RepID=A0AAD7F7C0_9AGAR|nr:hypothetical protein FB45DRAFT_949126 [Roridomyces roridus]